MRRCGNLSCNAHESGVCTNGIDVIGDCPDFQRGVADSDPDNGPVAANAVPNPVSPGSELTPAQTSRMLRGCWGQVIFLAGGVKSGKTTLIAEMYERFQRGPFASYRFAGSETLQAWERFSHLRRLASFGDAPDTERTRLETEFLFVHLRLSPENGGTPSDCFFSNVSGEMFDAMKDSAEECRKAVCLQRADRFLLLLDGLKLLKADQRPSEITGARNLLRGLLDTSTLRNDTPVELILSKWDLVADSSERSRAERAVTQLIEQIKAFSTPPRDLSSCSVSARPARGSSITDAYGIDQLLMRCAIPRVLELSKSESRPARGMLGFVKRY